MFDLYFSYFKVLLLIIGALSVIIVFIFLVMFSVNEFITYLIEDNFNRKYLKIKQSYLELIKNAQDDVIKELADYIKSRPHLL